MVCTCFLLWDLVVFFSERPFTGVIRNCETVRDDSRGGGYDTKSYYQAKGSVWYGSMGSDLSAEYRFSVEPDFQCSTIIGKKAVIYVSAFNANRARLNGIQHNWAASVMALLVIVICALSLVRESEAGAQVNRYD